MTFSEILNILLGGGFLALMVNVITLKATVRKANSDAEKAKADAESVHITNTENATRILVENIVKPLKEELNATREKLSAAERLMASIQKELASTKRALSRLSRAVESANNCPHADDCIVLHKLRNNSKEPDTSDGVIQGSHISRHNERDKTTDVEGYDTNESGQNGNINGQPP